MPKLFVVSVLAYFIFCLPACETSTPVTTAEAKLLAKQIETSVNKGRSGIMLHLIDMPSFVNKIEEQSETARTPGFMDGFLSTFSMQQFATQIENAVKGGSYKLLKAYEKDGKQHLLFRLFGTGGINYHDFTLIKVKDDVKASDVYVYLSGEELSGTMASFIDASSGKISTAGKKNSRLDAIDKIMQYKKEGDYVAEKNELDRLDTSLKNTKPMQLIYIMACKNVSDSAYKDALEGYAALYPNEPNAYLLMIDVYFLRHDYPKALFCMNKIDSLVGGDPYQDYFRGNLYKLWGNPAESKKSFERCFSAEPWFKANMQQLVQAYVADKQLDKAKAVIGKYKQNPDFKEDDLEMLYLSNPQLKEK